MAAVTICSEFRAQKIKFLTISIVSPSICHEVMGPDPMILIFWMFSFKPTFSLSFFNFIKKLFSSSPLSAIGWYHLCIWGYWYFSQQSWFSPVFLMMYSAYKLNKLGDNIQRWRTPFPVWNQSALPCPVLTVVSWPAHRFLRMQVRWSGIPISWRIFHSLSWFTQ